MEDGEIIGLFFERSERAISETAEKYGRYCRYIALGILNNEQDAEECVLDAYMRAWNSIPPKRPDRLGSYLGKIVRNLSLNALEKNTALKRGAGQAALVLDELSECIPDGHGEEDLTDDMHIKSVLDAFLGALPTLTRKIFVRRYWYMSSLKEIAAEYGISENRAAVTLLRTREKLRKVLEKEGVNL